MENYRARTALFAAFIIFTVIYILPNVVTLPSGWWFHNRPLSKGLDIQGGAHLIYGVDIKGVMSERTERMSRALEQEFKDKTVSVDSVTVNEEKNKIIIKTPNKAAALAYLKETHGTTLQVISETDNEIQLAYFASVMDTMSGQVINQAIEVIRNRVDSAGLTEPVIAAQGRDRILVQLPGVQDPAEAKKLINTTAKLDFRIVDSSMDPGAVAKLVEEAEKTGGFTLGGEKGLPYSQYAKKVNETLKGKLPPNTMISFEKSANATKMEIGKTAFLLRTDHTVGGDLLEDAFVSQGQYGEPNVSFRFGSEGRKKFAELTEKNVGKLLAIVLDEVIYSAPNIRERIDGQGQITLGSKNAEEAQKEGALIATTLRAGALPASLQQMEERSVGPSLGADSIERGKRAGIIGLVLVIIFATIWYKGFGIVASICLVLNAVSLLALLGALGATLTLPGIAGIALTLGMAIDANVLIYERIKEELKRGMNLKTATKEGFERAWSAIFDANVTHAIAASVLIYFGSGPVRGFGVTLIAGIVTTMITAVFATHYVLDLLIHNFKVKKLPI